MQVALEPLLAAIESLSERIQAWVGTLVSEAAQGCDLLVDGVCGQTARLAQISAIKTRAMSDDVIEFPARKRS